MPSRLAVLVSGRGSNLQAIIDHFATTGKERLAGIALVASNRADAPALKKAEAAGIDSATFNAVDDGTELLRLLHEFRIDLVVLAGYLRKIPSRVIDEYEGRIVNIHPALLPAFGGEGMYGARVHEAVIAAGAAHSGATVHLVMDEYDRGPLIAKWRIPVAKSDTAETLAGRVLQVEHVMYPRIIEMIAVLHQLESNSSS